MNPIQFPQMSLFTGGYRLLTAELTWHLDGVGATVDLGYSIKATDTGEQVELATLGRLSLRESWGPLAMVLDQIHLRAQDHLSPF